MDYLCQQLGELDVTTILPGDVERREVVINRATDVRTACMRYLASHIRHDAIPMGTIGYLSQLRSSLIDSGKVTKTVFRGDEETADATLKLKSSVESFNKALSNIHLRISIKNHELLKGKYLIYFCGTIVNRTGMADLKIQNSEHQPIVTDNFVVPFERNPWFTGRRKLLEMLKERLSDRTPKKHNHRVALYGMGGIGKTQTAIEYVYANRDSYKRIYWITAVDQASLVSGYQTIAIKAGLKTLLNLKPVELVEAVLSWLHQEQSWLLVIDNLDDITIVKGLLPRIGPHQHTLITTRNPNSAGIPAEGLEVPLLGPVDSIELLSTLSKIAVTENSCESERAHQIVQELGYLPLGIEQAAAYVREVAGNFATYLDHYNKNHKGVHQWIPQGNRSYPHSIATTWLMSFDIVRNIHPQAAELFQLLSFLNPDGILIDFLQDGMEALRDDLRRLLSNPIDMSKALIELEKFSLLKWNRLTKTVLVHRLVQHLREIDGADDVDVVQDEGLVLRAALSSRKNQAAFFRPPPVSSRISSREISTAHAEVIVGVSGSRRSCRQSDGR